MRLAEAEAARRARRPKLILRATALAVGALVMLGVIFFAAQFQLTHAPDAAPPPAESTLAESALTESATADNATEKNFRAQFLEKLTQYEQQHEPQLEKLRVANWDAEAAQELAALKQTALKAFAAGNFLSAREKIAQANRAATALEQAHAEQLTAAQQRANAELAAGDGEAAAVAVARAAQLAPADAAVVDLQKRLDALPKFLEFVRQAEVAKAENRPQAELDFLQQAAAVDPHAQLQERIANLDARVAQGKFTEAMRAAKHALDENDLAAATTHLTTAAQVQPNNSAVQILQQELERARAAQKLDRLIARAERAAANDAWADAAKHYADAKKIKPTDALEKKYQRAQEISDAIATTQRHLQNAHRLQDLNILQQVQTYADEISARVGASAQLKNLHRALVQTLDAYQAEVAVTILSDNLTFISIRGEGRVGKTRRKTIHLRAGNYIVVGDRAGYQSKLLRLQVPPHMPVSLTIICDTKI